MTDLFPDAPEAVTLQRQIEAVEREIKQRERVYPRLVDASKMTPQKAEIETAAMKAVLQTLYQVQKLGSGATQQRFARALCAEKCAAYGEPPCHQIAPESFHGPDNPCDEPGCFALASAVQADLVAGFKP